MNLSCALWNTEISATVISDICTPVSVMSTASAGGSVTTGSVCEKSGASSVTGSDVCS